MLYKGRISKWEEGQIPIQFCTVKEPVDLKYFPCSLLAVPTHIPELGRHHSSQENEGSLPVCPGTHRGPPDTNAQQLGVPRTLQLCSAGPIPREAPRNKLQAGPRQGKPPNKRSIHWRRVVQEGVKHRLGRQGTPPAPCATGKGLQGNQKTATVKHFSPSTFISRDIFVTTERNTCWLQQLLKILYNTVRMAPAVPTLSCRFTKIHCNMPPQFLFPHPTTNPPHQTVKLDKYKLISLILKSPVAKEVTWNTVQLVKTADGTEQEPGSTTPGSHCHSWWHPPQHTANKII